jgi:sugar/nucleoside kinase (ribokinase family)
LGFIQTDDFEQACLGLQKYAKRFAITCGADGAFVFDGEQLIQVAAPKVEPIDTNGAGDMFAGAFLFALSQANNFAQAAAFANQAAAQVVTQYGPRLLPAQHQVLKADFFGA